MIAKIKLHRKSPCDCVGCIVCMKRRRVKQSNVRQTISISVTFLPSGGQLERVCSQVNIFNASYGQQWQTSSLVKQPLGDFWCCTFYASDFTWRKKATGSKQLPTGQGMHIFSSD